MYLVYAFIIWLLTVIIVNRRSVKSPGRKLYSADLTDREETHLELIHNPLAAYIDMPGLLCVVLAQGFDLGILIIIFLLPHFQVHCQIFVPYS